MNIQDAINIFNRDDLSLRSPEWGYPIKLKDDDALSTVEKITSSVFTNSYSGFRLMNNNAAKLHYHSDETSIACVLDKKQSPAILTLYGKDQNYKKLTGQIFFKIVDRLRRAKIAFTADIFVNHQIEYKPKKNK